MFRHVVMFRWTPESSSTQRDEALAGLHAFAREISDLGTLRIGADAGVGNGNFDALVVADFPDRDAYLSYASDPRHVAMIARHIKPILGERAAVQTELA